MDYTPITPFRRMVDSVVLKHAADAQQDVPPKGVNKWEALRELATARVTFGLSDRDLSVLQALVSFHQNTILGEKDSQLIVHPSNKAICERLNGMPCSTMRRHLANLVRSGFVIRRDSPNGKRFARRYGNDKVAFGFDLSPLVLRFQEVCDAAEAARAVEERHKRLRMNVSLMRRDLAGLSEYGRSVEPGLALWDQIDDIAALTARDLRRKLSIDDLYALESRLGLVLDEARNALEPPKTEEMSTNDIPNEQHHQNSDKDSYESEPHNEAHPRDVSKPERINIVALEPKVNGHASGNIVSEDKLPNIPLGLVLTACHEFKCYSDIPVRHWSDLVTIADRLRPMMGISSSAWSNAIREMGPEEASVVVVAMLERFDEIHSPGGYLRSLTAKAAQGSFSCGPMIMALMRRDAA